MCDELDVLMGVALGAFLVAGIAICGHYQTVNPFEVMQKANYDAATFIDPNYPNEEDCVYYSVAPSIGVTRVDSGFDIADEPVYSSYRACFYHNGTKGLEEFVGNYTSSEFHRKYDLFYEMFPFRI